MFHDLRNLLVAHLVLSPLLFSSALWAQRPLSAGQPTVEDEKASKVDNLFHKYNQPDSPGCAVGVMKDGELVYSNAYGLADVQHRVALTTESLFNIGSMSKQFTAFSILLLLKEGKLRLEDDVRKYVPELPDYGTSITLRNLLEHSSGLRDQDELFKLAGLHTYEDLITNRDAMAIIVRQKKLNFIPGKDSAYSDTNYTLLGQIVERVSGLSLQDFERKNIFYPLGMKHTVIRNDHSMVVTNLTAPYIKDLKTPLRTGLTNDESTGAGNVLTSIKDFAAWDRNFYTPRIGSADLVDLMMTPGHLTNGNRTSYGLGLELDEYRGLKTVEHGGADAGFHSFYLRFPKENLAIAVFCNIRDYAGPSPGRLAKSVADIYLRTALPSQATDQKSTPSDDWKNLPARALAVYSGTYYNPKDGSVIVFRTENGVLIEIDDVTNESSKTKLRPIDRGRFSASENTSVNFSPENSSDRATIVTDGVSTIFYRMKPAILTARALDELAGFYRSDEVGSTWNVLVKDGKLVLRRPRFEDETPLPVYKDAFYGEQWTLVFVRNRYGQVVGMTATNERVRAIRFEKR